MFLKKQILFEILVIFVCVLFLSSFSSGQVVINEVFYDPVGNFDAGYEWIELLNIGGSSVSLNGYDLNAVSGDYFTFSSLSVPSGGIVLVHWRTNGTDDTDFTDNVAHLYTGTVGFDGNMGNSYGYIALFNSTTHSSSTILDYLEYGKGGQTWEGDAVEANIWTVGDFATDVDPGHSLEYDGSGNTGADWFDQATPTPGNDNSLPVFLNSFSAVCVQSGVLLRWQTESEVNNAGFYICRSENKDGEFQRISNLIKGAGNTNEHQKYEFIDHNVLEGKTYHYLIEDVDINGIITKHKIISIIYQTQNQKNNSPKSFEISPSYPNPFGIKTGNSSTAIQLTLSKQETQHPFSISIFNLLGQKVYQFSSPKFQPGEYLLNWFGLDDNGNKLGNGTYFWVIQTDKIYEVRRITLLR